MTWYKKGFGIIKTAYNPLFFPQINLNKKPFNVILVFISLDGMSSRIYSRIPPPLLFLSSPYGSENPWMRNCPTGNDESNFVSEVISMSILLFLILLKNQIYFLQSLCSNEYKLPIDIFNSKWIQTFFRIRTINNSRQQFTFITGNILTWRYIILKFETLGWNSLPDTLVKILPFRYWRQFSFVKNPEIFSAKTLIPCLLKCNLLSFKFLLGSMMSLWQRNDIFLSLHIKTRRLLTSVVLLSSLSDLGTIADIDKVFVSFFNNVPTKLAQDIFKTS